MKKVWKISGLDCANCAQQLENALAKVQGVQSVRVNFMAQTVSLSAADDVFDRVTDAVLAAARKVEPEAEIHVEDASHAAVAGEHHHDHQHEETHCGGHHHHDDDEDHCGCGGHHHHDDDDDDDCCDGHHHHDDDDDDHCACGHSHEKEQPLDESAPVADGMIRSTWPINGLDCAACAQKLQNAMAQLTGVNSVRVSYMSRKVQLVCAPDQLERLKRELEQVCLKLEPDAVIDFSQKAAVSVRKEQKKEKPVLLYRVASAVALSLIARLALPDSLAWLGMGLYVAAFLIVGYDVLWRALKNIGRGQIFDENFLMTVASVGAMAMTEYTQAIAVMTLYQIGEWFQNRAVEKSRASIAGLMDIRPDYANVIRGGQPVTVDPNDVRVGEVILVKPGEKLPLDGVIMEGASSLNTVALTGESLPRDVTVGDSVISGCVNLSGVIRVRVTAAFGESTVAKILELVETSGDSKARAERFISKFARWYTPAVCAAALLLAVIPPLCMGESWAKWIEQALSFLVISCPCALVISVPLSFFSGIGGASRKGILIKGANYMETLANLDTVAFDKTGTLTQGVFSVTQVNPVDGVTEQMLLETAVLAESWSDHPISRSLQKAWGNTPERSRVTGAKEMAGRGISALLDGRPVLAGNDRLMKENGMTPVAAAVGTVVHVALDGRYLGHVIISDVVKPTSAVAMAELKQQGVRRLVMLTGDRQAVADQVAGELGMTDVRAQLMPQDKVKAVEALLEDGKPVGFVGDGINDAPVLRRVDLGIAMGALGSDAAIEAADVVLMDDDPQRLALAMRIARRTMAIVKQNIIFALGVKAVILVLGLLGIANMWLAVFADVGVAMLAILNAMRAMRCR